MNYTMESSQMTAARCRSGGTPCPPSIAFQLPPLSATAGPKKLPLPTCTHYATSMPWPARLSALPQARSRNHLTAYMPATYLERGPTKEATSKNLKAQEFVVRAFIVECSRTIRRIHPQA